MVLLASIGARGGRLGTLGLGERCGELMVKISTVGPDAPLRRLWKMANIYIYIFFLCATIVLSMLCMGNSRALNTI